MSDVHKVIVIGTGFGGSVAACRLAQAGLRPLVLERGRRYGKDDFPALPTDAQLLPDVRRLTWDRDQGLFDLVDLEEVVSLQAAGYGGGSLIYANVHLRPPREVFGDLWPRCYTGRAALDEYYDLAGFMLDAAPMGSQTPQGLELPTKTRGLASAAAELGRKDEYFLPPLAVSRKEGLNEHGRYQRRCTQCGKCVTGCPEQAKNTLDFNYLAEAEHPEYGARFRTQCEVLDLEERSEGAQTLWAVRCYDHLRAQKCMFLAENVFLCAGSIHTTRLMARLTHDDPDSLVGVGYFAGGGAVGIIADTKAPLHPSEGPTITGSLVHWESDPASFFMLQDGGYARELERLVGIFSAPLWLGRNRLTHKAPGAPRPHDGGFRPDARTSESVSPPLPSPLDGLLDALAGGALDRMVPPQLRVAADALLAELRVPTLLPQIVDRTIESSIDWILANQVPWCWVPPQTDLYRLARRLLRWLASQLGDSEAIADRALRAILSFAGLARGEVASRMLGYSAAGAERRLMLLAMGRDAASGVLVYDSARRRLIADLDLLQLAPRYSSEERLMADVAHKLGGELRTNPAWAYLGKPVTVHNQGGCRMSDCRRKGVTDPDGAVYGKRGLYIVDGAALSTSVGVNPSATITALAERNVLGFIRKLKDDGEWPARDASPGAVQYRAHRERAQQWALRAQTWTREPPRPARGASVPIARPPLSLVMREWMQGYLHETTVDPGCSRKSDPLYRQLETQGRPEHPIELALELAIENLPLFYEDPEHRLAVRGSATATLPGDAKPRAHPVRGHLSLFAPRVKPYAASEARRKAQQHVVRSREPQDRSPADTGERVMTYELTFPDGPGWTLRGYKRIKDDPGIDAWRDTTSLFTQLVNPDGKRHAGVVHVDLTRFLYQQLPSIEVGYASRADPFTLERDAAGRPSVDPAQAAWAAAQFGLFFFGTLQRIYAPELRTALDGLFRTRTDEPRSRPSAPRTGP